MLEENVNPPGKVNSVVLITYSNLFEQLVSALENLRNLVPDCSVFRRLTVPFNILERLVKNKQNLNEQLSDSSLNKDLLNVGIGRVS